MRHLNENNLAFAILAVLILFILVDIVVPFSRNALLDTDLQGHVQAAEYIRNTLWPMPIGWDYRYFAGYPLHQFYGPLFSWLVALVSFIMPLTTAFKLLLILATLATPLSIYYCARSFSFSRLSSAIISLGTFAAFYYNYITPLGSDFNTVFHFGYAPNGFANPFLFLYIGVLNQSIKDKKILLPSILLVIVSLAHVFVGLTAWLFLVSLAIISWRNIGYLLEHAVVSSLLIAFWVLPFLIKFEYSASESGFVNTLTLGIIGLVFLIIAGFSIFYLMMTKRDRSSSPLIIYFSLLMLIFLIGMVGGVKIQLYRLFFPALLMAVFLSVRALDITKKRYLLFIPVVLSIIIIILSLNSINYAGPEPIELPDIGKLDGRIIVTAKGPGLHAFDSLVEFNDNLFAQGLYTESAANAGLFGIGMTGNELRTNNESMRRNLSKHLNHFAINWLIADDPTPAPYSEKKFFTTYQGQNISLYRIANSSYVEVLNYKPRRGHGGWKSGAETWFNDPESIIVFSESPLPDLVGTGNEKAEVVEIRHDYIHVFVNSTSPVPVFLKFSYFPNWRAYVNGEPTRIYQVLPALMLVYGQGDIELRYEQLSVDRVGWFLSGFGAFILIFIVYKKKNYK